MMIKTLSFALIFSLQLFSSQTFIEGKTTSENQTAVGGVMIINLNTNEKSNSDQNGDFKINTSVGDEVRFIKRNYERFSLKITNGNISTTLNIKLTAIPQEIEEVQINYKVVGDLKEDSKHFGEVKKVTVLNLDLLKYNKAYSTPELINAKPGEFKQPKGEGFETQKSGSKWDRMDLILYILKALGNDYFKSMGLNDLQMIPFIEFTIGKMSTYQMLRSGTVSSSDLAHFQAEAERQLQNFKNKN